MKILFDIFEQYGWVGLIGFIICLIVVLMLKKFGNKLSIEMNSGLERIGEKLTEQMSKQNDKLMDSMVDQQKQLIDYLINEKRADHSRHNDMISDKEDLAVDINDYLKDIMYIHNSQRAYILEFHNHNENLSGTPFVKFSCKYEWFEQGYDPLIGVCRDMAFASIAQITKDVRLSENQCVIYTDINKFAEANPSISYYIKGETTKAFIFKALYDKNNILIALLVLEYNHKIDVKQINYSKLLVESAELTQLINLRYKYEN